MQLDEDTPLTQFLVTAYEPDTIWVNHIPYSHSIILTPAEVKSWDENLSELLTFETELVLIGTNKPITAEQLIIFYEKNIGVEVMNTQAACRTYNLLANEGRRVIAVYSFDSVRKSGNTRTVSILLSFTAKTSKG